MDTTPGKHTVMDPRTRSTVIFASAFGIAFLVMSYFSWRSAPAPEEDVILAMTRPCVRQALAPHRASSTEPLSRERLWEAVRACDDALATASTRPSAGSGALGSHSPASSPSQ